MKQKLTTVFAVGLLALLVAVIYWIGYKTGQSKYYQLGFKNGTKWGFCLGVYYEKDGGLGRNTTKALYPEAVKYYLEQDSIYQAKQDSNDIAHEIVGEVDLK